MSVMSLPAHPLRRANDRSPADRVRQRRIGLAWVLVMAGLIGMAGPLFVAFFALGVVTAFGLRWMVI
jgi:hypothetical protein